MKFEMPKVGERVVVELEFRCNLLPELFPNQPSAIVYTGEMCGSAEFDLPDTFRITGGSQQIPVRIIPVRMVVKLNGKSVTHEIKERRLPEEHKVNGSKGAVYTIYVDEDSVATCTCAGYGFRKTCSHIKKLQQDGNVY